MYVATELQEVESVYERIDRLTPTELDALPHGAIQLDLTGRVLQFNAYESHLASIRTARVIGKNFFSEVAPCTNVKEFHGRFIEGVAKKQLHTSFRYHFAFKQSPRNVLITLFYSATSETVWVLIRPFDEVVLVRS